MSVIDKFKRTSDFPTDRESKRQYKSKNQN